MKPVPEALLNALETSPPRAGAWIETVFRQFGKTALAVAPRAGAWIETRGWGRPIVMWSVAPRAGAWIETSKMIKIHVVQEGRPPCGGVD